LHRLLAVCLLVVLVLYPSLAHAQGDESDGNHLDAYLLSAGYPQHVVSRLDPDLKLDLYEESAEFVRFVEGDASLIETADSDEEEGDIAAIGDYSEWYLYSRVSAPTGYTRLRVTYSWAWLQTPFWCLTDRVAMSWSHDWLSVPKTSEWRYQARRDGQVWKWSGTNATSPSVTSKAYSFNILRWYEGSPIDSHSGWLSTTLQTPTGSEQSQIAVLGKYFHERPRVEGPVLAVALIIVAFVWKRKKQ